MIESYTYRYIFNVFGVKMITIISKMNELINLQYEERKNSNLEIMKIYLI